MLLSHRINIFVILYYFERWLNHVTPTTVPSSTYRYLGKPGLPRWHPWAESITNVHLVNMTGEIFKDMEMKLEQAKTIQSKYMHKMTYELGTIAASIQDYFTHMLEVYRTFAKLENFINSAHSILEVMNAYHVIRDYNQIRYSRDMFYKVLERHKAPKQTRLKHLRHNNQDGNPNEDEILERLDRGERHLRRFFNRTFASDVLQRARIPLRSKTRESVNGPQHLVKWKPTARKLWKSWSIEDLEEI